jgi:putative endonuclease
MTSRDAATTARRSRRGRTAQRRGIDAEAAACAALEREGWTVLGRRLRTEAGEVDAVAEKDGLLAVLEVKSRPSLALAAACLSPRQRARLLAAAGILLAANPQWGRNGVRFDVLLVDAEGTVRRIPDAFRQEA